MAIVFNMPPIQHPISMPEKEKEDTVVIDIRYSIVANAINKKYGALISHCEEIKRAAKEICEINKSLPASEILRLAKEKAMRWGR